MELVEASRVTLTHICTYVERSLHVAAQASIWDEEHEEEKEEQDEEFKLRQREVEYIGAKLRDLKRQYEQQVWPFLLN